MNYGRYITVLGTTSIFSRDRAVKLHTEVTTLRKDVDKLEEDCKMLMKKYKIILISSVRTESAVKETEKKIESLFQLHNKKKEN